MNPSLSIWKNEIEVLGIRVQRFGVSDSARTLDRIAATSIEKETLKKRITNIEQGIMKVEVRYSIDLY
jgi:hypothetical protein